jgi:hypothetical protein
MYSLVFFARNFFITLDFHFPIPYKLPVCAAYVWSDNKVRELIAVKALHTSMIETHRGRLQSTPLWKLCTDAND